MYTIIFLIRGIVAQTKLFYHLHNADAEFDRLAASLIPDYRETIGYLSDIEERIDLTRIRLDHEGKEIIYSRECSEPMDSKTTHVLTGDLAAHFYSEGGIAAILEELPHQKFGLSSYDNGSHPEDIMNITIGESAFQIIEKWEFDLLFAIMHHSHSDWQTISTILEKSRELALGISLDLSGIPEGCQGNYIYYFENRVFYPLI